MAWGTKTSATQLTSITTEQYFSTIIALNGNEFADIQIRCDFPTTPTDHLVVSVYGTLDDSSETWDATPLMTFMLDKATDPNGRSVRVAGPYRFRIGVKRSGSTDTIVSADLSYRKWTP